MKRDAPHYPNIGAAGARRRRRGGVVALVAGVAATIILIVADAPVGSLLLTFFPFTWAAIGFLQARERT